MFNRNYFEFYKKKEWGYSIKLYSRCIVKLPRYSFRVGPKSKTKVDGYTIELINIFKILNHYQNEKKI